MSFTFEPQVATDAISTRLAQEKSAEAVIRCGAILVTPGFPPNKANANCLGSLIDVPYFVVPGTFQSFTSVSNNNNVTFNTGTPSVQQATVGIAPFGWTYDDWTRMSMIGVGDPYGKLADSVGAKWDRFVVERSITAMDGSALTVDGSSGLITYDKIVSLLGTFGDQEQDICCILVHSRVRNDMRRIKDANGNPILLEFNGVPALSAAIPRGDVALLFGKYPVMVSDLCTVTAASGQTPEKVNSYVLKKSSVIFWYDRGGFTIQSFDVIGKSPTQHQFKVEPYYANHRYSPYPNSSYDGVAILQTQATAQ